MSASKCPECGAMIIKVHSYTTYEAEYEYVCSRCGLVFTEEEYLAMADEGLKCRVCGEPVKWKRRGRKPKYCQDCAKKIKRLHDNCKYNFRKKQLTKKDVFLIAIQKKAS